MVIKFNKKYGLEKCRTVSYALRIFRGKLRAVYQAQVVLFYDAVALDSMILVAFNNLVGRASN